MPAIPAPDDQALNDAGAARRAPSGRLGLALVRGRGGNRAARPAGRADTIRVRRQDLAGAGQAQHEDVAPEPAATRQHQDRAALAARVRPCRPC